MNWLVAGFALGVTIAIVAEVMTNGHDGGIVRSL